MVCHHDQSPVWESELGTRSDTHTLSHYKPPSGQDDPEIWTGTGVRVNSRTSICCA